MPKSMNIKKAASALHQNQRQINAALKGAEVEYGAVEKSLGRAQFLLKLTNHKTATGTPRGLFTSGTMRISPGQIVIIQGCIKTGFEIVGCISDLKVAQKLVTLGLMPADILASASTVGSVAEVVKDDDLFDYSQATGGEVEVSAKGGVAGTRRQQESLAAAAALAVRLGADEVDIDAI